MGVDDKQRGDRSDSFVHPASLPPKLLKSGSWPQGTWPAFGARCARTGEDYAVGGDSIGGVDDVRWLSAVQQGRLLQRGMISASELRAAAFDAINQLDEVLHAVVGPLFDRPSFGVPMLLKDAGQEIAGTPYWVGVAALRDAGSTSVVTTELAARFEAIGLSIIGKAACPQMSGGATTEPPGFEATRNPWDRDRSVGGSSGGPAPAVAAGMVPVAHGSDATGSLRCPAALCGVATLNPTAGRIRGVPPAGQPATCGATSCSPDTPRISSRCSNDSPVRRPGLFLVTVSADVLRGAYVDPDAGKVTFTAFAERWLAAQTFTESSSEVTELRLRLHAARHFGNRELRSIKPSVIQAWLRKLQQALAPTYVRTVFTNVSAVFKRRRRRRAHRLEPVPSELRAAPQARAAPDRALVNRTGRGGHRRPPRAVSSRWNAPRSCSSGVPRQDQKLPAVAPRNLSIDWESVDLDAESLDRCARFSQSTHRHLFEVGTRSRRARDRKLARPPSPLF